MTTEPLLYEDLGLQERNGKMYYVSIFKGRELLTNAEEAEAFASKAQSSGEIGRFRWESDSSKMTRQDIIELDSWLNAQINWMQNDKMAQSNLLEAAY